MLIVCSGKNGKWHAEIAYIGRGDETPCPLCEAKRLAKEAYDRGYVAAEIDAARVIEDKDDQK